MLELHNVRMKPLSVRKCKGITQCGKKTVICDVGTVQCEVRIVQCEDQMWEKKVREPPNVRKEL